MRLSLTVCAAVLLSAQSPEPRPQTARLLADLNFLTSDVLAGRQSLTPQADIAARYIAASFQRSSLQPIAPGYLQEFPLVAYRVKAQGRQLILKRDGQSKAFRSGPDFAGGFYRDIDIEAPLVFAGFGVTAPEYGYDDYAGLDARGKIVIMFDHEPQEDNPKSVFNGLGNTLYAGRASKLNNARRHGAVAVLIAPEPGHAVGARQSNSQSAPRAPTRVNAPPQASDDPQSIPVFTITQSTLDELLAPAGRPAEIQKAIDANLKPRSCPLAGTLTLRNHNAEQRRGISLNAVGLLEGSDPALKSETIVIDAHYDHLGVQNGMIYRGANDNASGTVAVMELARMFASSTDRPKRSILFIVFGSEEEPLLGSFYYTAHPLRPLETTRADLNLDMIARDETPAGANQIYLVGAFYSPDLRHVIERANRGIDLTLDNQLDADHTLNVLFRCDHLPFLMANIPAVWFFGGFHPGYHEPVDTVDRLNITKLEKVTQLAYRTAVALANAPTVPRFTAN